MFGKKKKLINEMDTVKIHPIEIELEPLILKATKHMDKNEVDELKKELEGVASRKIILLPHFIEVINPQVTNTGIARVIQCQD